MTRIRYDTDSYSNETGHSGNTLHKLSAVSIASVAAISQGAKERLASNFQLLEDEAKWHVRNVVNRHGLNSKCGMDNRPHV